jgi:hypothetical protein
MVQTTGGKPMTNKEAIKTLKLYQKWRMGSKSQMLTPKEVTVALIHAIKVLQQVEKEETK